MTFRSSILPALEAADKIMLELDLSPTAVEIITRRWSGGEIKVGNPGDSILTLPKWLIVDEMSNREVNESGGRYIQGDLRVGPIRPYFSNSGCSDCEPANGGFTVEQLEPYNTDESTEIFYRVTQQHSLGTGWSGDYSLVELNRDDPLEFYLVIRRVMENKDHIAALAL